MTKKVEKTYSVKVDKESAKLVTASQKVAVARAAVVKAQETLANAQDKLRFAVFDFEDITDSIKYPDVDDVAYGDEDDGLDW